MGGDKGGADVGGGGGGEPAKTLLLPFLQRADELQKHDPLVAYYCRLFGMERGLKIPSKERTKTTNALLVSLMNQLEKDKKTVKLSPDDNLHVEGFALGVFSKADKQDRAGRADLNTAKTFYAASIFFEVLNQFGELQPEIEQKQKYAVWKAADIRKALSEGRKPQPGPPGGDEGFSLDELEQEEDGLKSPESTTARTTFSAESDAHSKSENGDFSPGYSNPSSFQDHHTMQGRYPTGYGGYPSTPPSDHTVPPPVPDGSYPTNSAFPSQGFRSPGFYDSPVPNDRTEDAPPFPSSSYAASGSFNYPSQTTGSGSFNYPSAPTTASGSFNYPSAPTTAPGSFNYPGAPATDSHAAPFTTSYEAPAPPPTYENPLQRTSSAPANPEVPKSGTYDSGYNPPPEKIAEAHKASRFAVGALAFDDVPTAISYLRRSLELLTSPSATIR